MLARDMDPSDPWGKNKIQKRGIVCKMMAIKNPLRLQDYYGGKDCKGGEKKNRASKEDIQALGLIAPWNTISSWGDLGGSSAAEI